MAPGYEANVGNLGIRFDHLHYNCMLCVIIIASVRPF